MTFIKLKILAVEVRLKVFFQIGELGPFGMENWATKVLSYFLLSLICFCGKLVLSATQSKQIEMPLQIV